MNTDLPRSHASLSIRERIDKAREEAFFTEEYAAKLLKLGSVEAYRKFLKSKSKTLNIPQENLLMFAFETKKDINWFLS